MATLKLGEKIIDEQRQGEVFGKGANGQAQKKMYLESYGCQMNFSDSEIVASIMIENGYQPTKDIEEADVVFINTCAIRDNAEHKIRTRLQQFKPLKKKKPGLLVGVLGCMAERLKTKLLEQEKLVDLVVGPDAYRDLPKLVREAETGEKAVNVFLSREETYADISPVRLDNNGVSGYISIMRGCDNMCSFCVVPFTRGRERSRNPWSIAEEARELSRHGYKEVTLLGQNVDSFHWQDEENSVNFAQLLEMVAQVDSDMRVRFSTSHPKDITPQVVETIRDYDNICNYIHLPAQSGNSRILERMNRNYSREWYMDKVDMIKSIEPDIGLSTDMIAGFCSETEEDHQETLSLMEQVRYDHAFMFMYSERPNTPAAKWYEDDVPEETKKRRLQEIIELQNKHSLESNQHDIGKVFNVLVESHAKRSSEQLKARNTHNKRVLFPKEGYEPGDYVRVKVTDCNSANLFGEIVE